MLAVGKFGGCFSVILNVNCHIMVHIIFSRHTIYLFRANYILLPYDLGSITFQPLYF